MAFDRWKKRVRALKAELLALYLARKDPRVPQGARILAAAVVAYAFSPIDLIPDFIPVLGYLDDLILLPLGIWLVLRMIPPEVMAEHRARARQEMLDAPPVSRGAALFVVLVWLLLTAWAALLLGPRFLW